MDEYVRRAPEINANDKMFNHFRAVWRSMLNQGGERTLLPCIIPPQTGHVDLVFEFYADPNILVPVVGTFSSLPFDYYIKATGKAHARFDVVRNMPFLESKEISAINMRTLLLNCLTRHYADLWRKCFDESFTTDSWAKSDPCLANSHFSSLTPRVDLGHSPAHGL